MSSPQDFGNSPTDETAERGDRQPANLPNVDDWGRRERSIGNLREELHGNPTTVQPSPPPPDKED